jgi:hypothetical protein
MDIEELVPHDPAFVADVYRAAFSHREPSEEKTPMGSSALLPMTSTRRQDFEMAHDALEQAFPAFLEQAPAQAVDALDATIDGYVAWRRLEHDRTVVRFRLGDRVCGIRADTSHVWASGGAHHEEERMVGALGTALEADDERAAGALADAIASGTRNAALWARLPTAAAQWPERFAQRLGEVLRKTALYTMTDVRHAMALALAALHPLLDDASRAAAERAVLRIPDGAAPDVRDLREELRDGLLASLDAAALAAPAARRRRAEIDARDQAPDAPDPPFAFTMSWRSGSVTPAEMVAEEGADPARAPNATLLELSEPVSEFAERHRNELPDNPARKAILTPLKRLWAALGSAGPRPAGWSTGWTSSTADPAAAPAQAPRYALGAPQQDQRFPRTPNSLRRRRCGGHCHLSDQPIDLWRQVREEAGARMARPARSDTHLYSGVEAVPPGAAFSLPGGQPRSRVRIPPSPLARGPAERGPHAVPAAHSPAREPRTRADSRGHACTVGKRGALEVDGRRAGDQ